MDILAVAVAAAIAARAPAADAAPIVTGTHFFAIDPRNLQLRPIETSRIPHRPGASCYEWAIEVEREDRTLTVREVFQLPAAAEQWGISPGQVAAVTTDRSRAVTEIQDSLADGLISHGWCVAEGDPTGPHHIQVYVGERLLHEFHFELVPETY